VDGWVGSGKDDETAEAGECVLGSLLYGDNERIDGIMVCRVIRDPC